MRLGPAATGGPQNWESEAERLEKNWALAKQAPGRWLHEEQFGGKEEGARRIRLKMPARYVSHGWLYQAGDSERLYRPSRGIRAGHGQSNLLVGSCSGSLDEAYGIG
jgi:hypothetical protein